MLVRWYLFLLFVCTSLYAAATHNRSGEITYRHLYGNTYEFTITTCTKLTSEANRTELEIQYGDGTIDTIPRVNFFDFPATDTKQNYYTGTHTYAGAGTFVIMCEDPNRNANVLNIANSVDKIFCIQTQLVISPFLGKPNNSPVLIDCPCPEETCNGKPWIYNLGAYDPDGDSLTYALIPCKGEDCFDMSIPDIYQYPQDIGGGTLSVDATTGTLFWNAPLISGEYNLAVIISEFRHGVKIGHVIRDMQVTVKGLCLNNPPDIEEIHDKCVEAGTNLSFEAYADDTPATPQDFPILHWEYFGEAFFLPQDSATFDPSPDGNPITGDFNWEPGCSAVRNSQYIFTLEATDAGPNVILKDIETWRIKVNAPPVENLAIGVEINSFDLSWSMADCPQVTGYNIYRMGDSATFPADLCCTPNFPLTQGYSLLTTVSGRTDTTYTDAANIQVGNQYCYIVTAVFQNGAESCISGQVCGELDFQLPILTNATIGITDAAAGVDTIRWSHPQELDLSTFTGPYRYTLYQAEGLSGNYAPIFSTPFEAVLTDCDTFFIQQNLNTQSTFYNYKVSLTSNGTELGASSSGSTIFLHLIPNDNQLELVWNETVPWVNTAYEVWKEVPTGSGNYILLATVPEQSYIDSNLLNETSYCYKIRSIGGYSLSGIQNPLLNWSNTACAEPTDLTPPCAPTFGNVAKDCEAHKNTLSWETNTGFCAEDIVGYRVYYAAEQNATFQQIAYLPNTANSFVFEHENNLAGCFYITSYDSLPNQNESAESPVICIENCDPVYILPNVFTPNGDSGNDLYHPLLPYKYIASVNFVLLNRWGQTIFETTNPMISWDGKDQKSGLPVSDGVYTYLCKVYVNTLNGVRDYDLHGFVHVVR